MLNLDLYFYVRISVLTVEFGLAVPVLDCELRTMMQASETQRAFFLYPDRLLVMNFNRLDRTFSCTQTTSDALVLHIEILCLALGVQQRIGENSERIRQAW